MGTVVTPNNMKLWYRKIKSPRWDDLRFPATGINPPGAVGDPDRDTTTGLLLFAKAATESVVIQAQLPHDRAPGTRLDLHVHWAKDAAGAGDVYWQVAVQKWRIGEVIDSAVTTGTASIVSSLTDNGLKDEHLITEVVAVDGSDMVDSDMLHITLSRVGGNAADTYDDDAQLLEFDIHYMRDGLGSIHEYGDGYE